MRTIKPLLRMALIYLGHHGKKLPENSKISRFLLIKHLTHHR